MDYEVLAPTSSIKSTNDCTNSACTVIDGSCNKTIKVSTAAKICSKYKDKNNYFAAATISNAIATHISQIDPDS